jgi:predicted N-acyltransferase
MPSRSWRCPSQLEAISHLSLAAERSDPFLTLPFLQALQSSAAVGTGTSWEPVHLLFRQDDTPAALLPLYRKFDSRGEYVFDHAWANAYQRYGLAYYPKLVTAIPFTPVPGPRLLLAPGQAKDDWLTYVLDAIKQECHNQQASGWHGLFVDESWVEPAIQAGLAVREGCRFHWTNPGYRDFNDYLAVLTSKKRKDIKRERRKVTEQGLSCRKIPGREIDLSLWDFFYQCYTSTYFEHGQHPYLSREFFRLIASHMADQLTLVLAEDRQGPLASALFFKTDETLYGRYWGAVRTADCLHFEVCYYQGIEQCIQLGLKNFDPGTQGEHKLLRGFAPKLTYSLHWLREAAFQEAILQFVGEERKGIRRYLEAAEAALPFRESGQ